MFNISTVITFTLFLPLVLNGAPLPEAKMGYAPSSHTRVSERVAQMPDTVQYWRGWQRSSAAGPMGRLEPVQGYWCDFYFHHQYSDGRLIPQQPVLDSLGKSFDGELLFLNEPDLVGQCTVSPQRGAQLYIHVRNSLPNAKMVGPGISERDWQSDFKWLRAFVKEVKRLTGSPPDMYAWDIHNYTSVGDPLEPYDDLEELLANEGVTTPKFFVSEFGNCDMSRLIEMRDAYLKDSRILKFFVYDQTLATWDGTGRCILLFDETTMDLTNLGRAWLYGWDGVPRSSGTAVMD